MHNTAVTFFPDLINNLCIYINSYSWQVFTLPNSNSYIRILSNIIIEKELGLNLDL